MKCDTCGKEAANVRRVIVDADYDRTLAKAVYNCQECYEKKERLKTERKKSQG